MRVQPRGPIYAEQWHPGRVLPHTVETRFVLAGEPWVWVWTPQGSVRVHAGDWIVYLPWSIEVLPPHTFAARYVDYVEHLEQSELDVRESEHDGQSPLSTD